MSKNCFGGCFVYGIATWGFFALLLTLLGIENALVNAIWLALLIGVAIACCPIINPRLSECCIVKPKKKK